MIKMVKRKWLSVIFFSLLIISTTVFSEEVSLDDELSAPIVVKNDTLFPESITYNPFSDRFIIGSFRQGAIFEVDRHGNTKKIIDDEQLRSVFSVRIDESRNMLYALTSDLGVSIKSKSNSIKRYAALAIYDLATNKRMKFINLENLIPNVNHLVNGMTLDNHGNAYITDSFTASIYKVDTNGIASIFLQDKEFEGNGINLNGIVYHPNGYLITAKKSNGVLYKIPINKPESFYPIKSDQKYLGADGLILSGSGDIVIITNRVPGHISDTVFSVSSDNEWKSMKTTDKHPLGNVYPTTGVIKNNQIYVVHSQLNDLVSASKNEIRALRRNAKIQKVGQFSSQVLAK